MVGDFWTVTQQESERGRVVVEGQRLDDHSLCTVVVVHERGGSWAWYPHGFGKFGVRLPKAEAVRMARRIIKDAEG